MSAAEDTTTLPASPLAELAAQWRAAGILPPEGTPVSPAASVSTAELVRRHRLARFLETCPAEFRQKIAREKIPNLAAWDEADAWPMTPPGLWLWSHASGRAKTRMAWRLFGRAHVEQGRHVIKVTGQALVEDYFACHMEGEPRHFYRRMLAPDILIIDDLDKADLDSGMGKARNGRAIRELWDELYAHRKAVVVTANEPIAWFAGHLGESCARRMREVCREIAF